MVVSACQALGSPIQNEVFSGDLSPCAVMILSLIQSPYLDRVGGEGAAAVPRRQAVSASSSFSRSAVSSRFPQHSSPGKLLLYGCLRQWSTVCPSPQRSLLPDWEPGGSFPQLPVLFKFWFTILSSFGRWPWLLLFIF